LTRLPIIWADEARELFLEYLFFISEKDEGAAERLFEQVERSLEPVAFFPNSGRPGRVPGTREIVSHPNYLTIYEVHNDFIKVVDFTHARKLYPPSSG